MAYKPTGALLDKPAGIGGANPGNKNSEKFDTPEKRINMFGRLLKHLSEGLGKNCFPDCDWDTVLRYVDKYPDECPRDEFETALRMGNLFWESMGRSGAFGRIDGFNAAAWIFNMKNKYSWKDRTEISDGGKSPEAIAQAKAAEMTDKDAEQFYLDALHGFNSESGA